MWTVSRGIVIFLSLVTVSHEAWSLDRDGESKEAAGEVVSVYGKVYVRQETDGKPDAVTLRPAQNVFEGDIINTSSEGSVKILLKDKSIVDLGPSSLFKVTSFKAKDGANREVDLDMKFGRLRVAVTRKLKGDGKFNVKTRAATMGVRGTEFVVNTALSDANKGANAPKTDVTVLQGKVDVKSASPVGGAADVKSLTAGGKISAQVGVPSTLMQLNERQMVQVSSTAKVADNTFVKAITIEAKPQESKSGEPSRGLASESQHADGAKPGSEKKPGAGPAPASVAAVAAPEAPAAGTLANAVKDIAASAPTVPVSFTEIGVPGAPSVVNATNTTVNQVNRSYRLTVIVGP